MTGRRHEDHLRADDRERLLDLAVERIGAAWRSFDRPRAREATVDPQLAGRLTAGLPEEPGNAPDAVRDATDVLDASISPARPLYLAYVGSTGLAAGALGAALAATYDVNMASHAAGADLLDGQALRWSAEFVGYPHADGAFTSGGQISNLTAIVAARERALPGSRETGLGGARAAVYCSSEAHGSVARAAEIAGLGRRSVRRLSTGPGRRLDPDAVEAAIRTDRAAGITPVAVIANGGTTLTGAVDPLDDLADVCTASDGLWLHVDGAYGLPAARTPSGTPLFAGLERADSVMMDAHKWLGVQKGCSVVLVRDVETLDAAFGHRETYMLHRDGTRNPVDRTLEYSRPFRSLRLWLAFRVHGAANLRAWIERTIANARAFADLVREDPALELLDEPQLSTVCFRHTGPAADLDLHNLALAHRVQADGRVYLAPALLDGATCLRVCFVNFRTTREQVAQAHAVVRELAGGG